MGAGDKFLCMGCNKRLERRAFHEWSPQRRRPVMPRCRACRSESYFKSKYMQQCQGCRRHRRLDRNTYCRDCNARQGLRQCAGAGAGAGACRDLLPIELCFYGDKARCKDCLQKRRLRP